MKWFPSFGFQRRKRELQEEIDAHLQMAVADRVARGETAEAARQAAAREFGNRGIYLTPLTPRYSVLGHGRGLSEDFAGVGTALLHRGSLC